MYMSITKVWLYMLLYLYDLACIDFGNGFAALKTDGPRDR